MYVIKLIQGGKICYSKISRTNDEVKEVIA